MVNAVNCFMEVMFGDWNKSGNGMYPRISRLKQWINRAHASGYDDFDWKDRWVFAVAGQYLAAPKFSMRKEISETGPDLFGTLTNIKTSLSKDRIDFGLTWRF